MSSPALGRRWWAERGRGAWSAPISTTTIADGTALRCTTTDAIDDAVIVVTPPDRYLAERFVPVATALRRRDPDAQASFAHAALSVAEGDADAALVLRGGPWDYAAVVVIVEEAGGHLQRSVGWAPPRHRDRGVLERHAPSGDPRGRGRVAPGATRCSLKIGAGLEMLRSVG